MWALYVLKGTVSPTSGQVWHNLTTKMKHAQVCGGPIVTAIILETCRCTADRPEWTPKSKNGGDQTRFDNLNHSNMEDRTTVPNRDLRGALHDGHKMKWQWKAYAEGVPWTFPNFANCTRAYSARAWRKTRFAVDIPFATISKFIDLSPEFQTHLFYMRSNYKIQEPLPIRSLKKNQRPIRAEDPIR